MAKRVLLSIERLVLMLLLIAAVFAIMHILSTISEDVTKLEKMVSDNFKVEGKMIAQRIYVMLCFLLVLGIDITLMADVLLGTYKESENSSKDSEGS